MSPGRLFWLVWYVCVAVVVMIAWATDTDAGGVREDARWAFAVALFWPIIVLGCVGAAVFGVCYAVCALGRRIAGFRLRGDRE